MTITWADNKAVRVSHLTLGARSSIMLDIPLTRSRSLWIIQATKNIKLEGSCGRFNQRTVRLVVGPRARCKKGYAVIKSGDEEVKVTIILKRLLPPPKTIPYY